MTKEENYKLASELKSKVEEWVDGSFNFIRVEVYEKMSDGLLIDYVFDTRTEEEIEAGYEPPYPMWSTLFEFRDEYFNQCDEMQENILKFGMGIIQGVKSFNLTIFMTSAGHSFYSDYWIPLYLSWYKKEAERYQGVDYSMV